MDRLKASFHFDILGFWPELKLQTSSVTVSAHRLPLAQTQTEIRLEVINLGGWTCWGNKHSTSTPICIQSYLFASSHHIHFLAVGKKVVYEAQWVSGPHLPQAALLWGLVSTSVSASGPLLSWYPSGLRQKWGGHDWWCGGSGGGVGWEGPGCRLLRPEARRNCASETQRRGSPEGEVLSAKLDEVPPLVLNISFPWLFVLERSQRVIIVLPLSHQLTKVYPFGSFLINQSPPTSLIIWLFSFNSLSCAVIYGSPSSKGKHYACSESWERLLWNFKGPVKENCTSEEYFVRWNLSELWLYSFPLLPQSINARGKELWGGSGRVPALGMLCIFRLESHCVVSSSYLLPLKVHLHSLSVHSDQSNTSQISIICKFH